MKLWSRKVYADTAASTPLDPRVLTVLTQTAKNIFGNPSSIHRAGLEAGKILDTSREKIAGILGVSPEEIVFTSGGTEANNLAIRGAFEAYYKKTGKPAHIIVSAIEHKSVLEAAENCKIFGGRVTVLPVDQNGHTNLTELKNSFTEDTVLVSVGYVNNEVGTVVDLKQISKIIRDYRKKQGTAFPYFHTDACQAPRFFSLKAESLGIDMMTINGSKIYGPKGVGCLYLNKDVKINPIQMGGGQEFGLRSGTQNVAGISAFSTALEICEQERDAQVKNVSTIRDYLVEEIKKQISGAIFYGSTESTNRAPNNINVGFDGVMAEDLVIGLDVLGIEASTGSACSSKSKPESHVLKALGFTSPFSSIRLSLGKDTNKKEANIIIEALKKETTRLRRK